MCQLSSVPLDLGFHIVTLKTRIKDGDVIFVQHMGVSKNRGIPKWMVYNGSKPYQNG